MCADVQNNGDQIETGEVCSFVSHTGWNVRWLFHFHDVDGGAPAGWDGLEFLRAAREGFGVGLKGAEGLGVVGIECSGGVIGPPAAAAAGKGVAAGLHEDGGVRAGGGPAFVVSADELVWTGAGKAEEKIADAIDRESWVIEPLAGAVGTDVVPDAAVGWVGRGVGEGWIGVSIYLELEPNDAGAVWRRARAGVIAGTFEADMLADPEAIVAHDGAEDVSAAAASEVKAVRGFRRLRRGEGSVGSGDIPIGKSGGNGQGIVWIEPVALFFEARARPLEFAVKETAGAILVGDEVGSGVGGRVGFGDEPGDVVARAEIEVEGRLNYAAGGGGKDKDVGGIGRLFEVGGAVEERRDGNGDDFAHGDAGAVEVVGEKGGDIDAVAIETHGGIIVEEIGFIAAEIIFFPFGGDPGAVGEIGGSVERDGVRIGTDCEQDAVVSAIGGAIHAASEPAAGEVVEDDAGVADVVAFGKNVADAEEFLERSFADAGELG